MYPLWKDRNNEGGGMNNTKIEWVKNPDGTQGYTWNPITGCLNGCDYCYARKVANTRLKERYLANKNWVTGIDISSYPNNDPFYPRFWEDRMSCQFSYYGKKAQGIFVCSMSDLFGIGIPEQWIRKVLALIEVYPRHRFYLLTKQPRNLAKFSPFPDNCRVGVSATSDRHFYDAVCYLRDIEAEVKYISIEPMLTEITTANPVHLKGCGINWIIIGSQTKPTVHPKIKWVKDVVEAADLAGIPVFLKDNLKPLIFTTVNGKDIVESHNLWACKYFKLRQEMPR